jgi:hypothetical protein
MAELSQEEKGLRLSLVSALEEINKKLETVLETLEQIQEALQERSD